MGPGEDLDGIHKVDAVFLNVRPSLVGIPAKFHIYAYIRTYILRVSSDSCPCPRGDITPLHSGCTQPYLRMYQLHIIGIITSSRLRDSVGTTRGESPLLLLRECFRICWGMNPPSCNKYMILGLATHVAPITKGDTICTGNFLYGQFQSPLVPQGLREPQLWAVKAPGQQGKTARAFELVGSAG